MSSTSGVLNNSNQITTDFNRVEKNDALRAEKNEELRIIGGLALLIIAGLTFLIIGCCGFGGAVPMSYYAADALVTIGSIMLFASIIGIIKAWY